MLPSVYIRYYTQCVSSPTEHIATHGLENKTIITCHKVNHGIW